VVISVPFHLDTETLEETPSQSEPGAGFNEASDLASGNGAPERPAAARPSGPPA
jgi:hypothetical protein